MKTININNINLKEILLSKQDGKISIGLYYSYLTDDGTELNHKRDIITEDEMTTGQKTKVNDIFNFIETKIKAKENI